MKTELKSFLYNVSFQQEKVKGSVKTLIDELYKDLDEETRLKIVEDIIKGLKRYDDKI